MIDHLNEGAVGDAEEELKASEFNNNNEDANILGVRALIAYEKNGNIGSGENNDWKRWVERAVAASNVLVKRQISFFFFFLFFYYFFIIPLIIG